MAEKYDLKAMLREIAEEAAAIGHEPQKGKLSQEQIRQLLENKKRSKDKP